MLENLVFNYL